jgi:hypothetical protein
LIEPLASHGTENTMPRHVCPVVPAVFIVCISAFITLGINDRVLAGSECIEQPNREPAQGAHWYYHYDREKNRKCWHLDAAATTMREAAPPRKDQTDPAAPTPTIGSVFSTLFGAGPPPPSTSTPQDAASGEPRIIQSNPTKPLKIEDIAQRQPDIPEEHAEQRYVTPLSPAQRRTLFQEYLRWEEIQRNLGASARSP